ncbi:MAG: hypothetical protein A3D28_04635 [Omnitrophica bacterium RIFCSPHIGHO2_02_FULL_63_14]|nr:MAG: hypothetical protein A3D28_04635 [Omnitrophica bacterium RIFCSPHIGHO2_02_FULL_63_14]
MFKAVREFFEGAWSLIAGLGVTGRYMFKRRVTVLYPKERIAIKRFKGPILFVNYDKPDPAADHKCISCNACIKICPSRCMSLTAGKSAADGKRILTDFKVNYMLCSLCSLCIDVCPTEALQHAEGDYDMVSATQGPLVIDLLKPFREKGSPLAKVPVVTHD